MAYVWMLVLVLPRYVSLNDLNIYAAKSSCVLRNKSAKTQIFWRYQEAKFASTSLYFLLGSKLRGPASQYIGHIIIVLYVYYYNRRQPGCVCVCVWVSDLVRKLMLKYYNKKITMIRISLRRCREWYVRREKLFLEYRVTSQLKILV